MIIVFRFIAHHLNSSYGTGNIYRFFVYYALGAGVAWTYSSKKYQLLLDADVKIFGRKGWHWLVEVGYYSLGIYCSHFLFLPFLPVLGLSNLTNFASINTLISTLFVVLLAILLSIILDKNWVTSLVLMGKTTKK